MQEQANIPAGKRRAVQPSWTQVDIQLPGSSISIASIVLGGQIAGRRGRRFKTWAWIAVLIGPLALPLLYLLPDLHDNDAGPVAQTP